MVRTYEYYLQHTIEDFLQDSLLSRLLLRSTHRYIVGKLRYNI